jgi:hypothetical protein
MRGTSLRSSPSTPPATITAAATMRPSQPTSTGGIDPDLIQDQIRGTRLSARRESREKAGDPIAFARTERRRTQAPDQVFQCRRFKCAL